MNYVPALDSGEGRPLYVSYRMVTVSDSDPRMKYSGSFCENQRPVSGDESAPMEYIITGALMCSERGYGAS